MPIQKMSMTGQKTRQMTKEAAAARTHAGSASNASLFAALRKLLLQHAPALVVARDRPGDYQLDTRVEGANGKPVYFAAVRTGRSSTSFHLMPLATSQALDATLSEHLRARLTGKSCFTFRAIEPGLFQELATLTEQALADWKREGKLG